MERCSSHMSEEEKSSDSDDTLSVPSLDSDSEVELILIYSYIQKRQKKRKKRAIWMQDIYRSRDLSEFMCSPIRELNENEENYFKFFNMPRHLFETLLTTIEPMIEKQTTNYRKPISPYLRLAVTLRYLASGVLQRDLISSFRMARSTISNTLKETTNAIWVALQPLYFKLPDAQQWKAIAQDFWDCCRFPNCIGALDGKRITMKTSLPPGNSGTKLSSGLSLLAICDAQHRFVLMDICATGLRRTEMLAQSWFGRALENSELPVPLTTCLPGSTVTLPHVLVGDETFPLNEYILCPYSSGKNLSEDEAVFNYRLERVHRHVENTFGILASRWKIFHRPANTSVDGAISIVKACICLHNFLQTHELGIENHLKRYCPPSLIDCENSEQEVIPGEWRHLVTNEVNMLQDDTEDYNPQKQMSPCSLKALTHRDKLKEYFQTSEGALPWQDRYTREGQE